MSNVNAIFSLMWSLVFCSYLKCQKRWTITYWQAIYPWLVDCAMLSKLSTWPKIKQISNQDQLFTVAAVLWHLSNKIYRMTCIRLGSIVDAGLLKPQFLLVNSQVPNQTSTTGDFFPLMLSFTSSNKSQSAAVAPALLII